MSILVPRRQPRRLRLPKGLSSISVDEVLILLEPICKFGYIEHDIWYYL